MISKKQIISDKDFGKIHFVVRRSARNITMRVKEDGLHVTTPPYRSITALLEAIAQCLFRSKAETFRFKFFYRSRMFSIKTRNFSIEKFYSQYEG